MSTAAAAISPSSCAGRPDAEVYAPARRRSGREPRVRLPSLSGNGSYLDRQVAGNNGPLYPKVVHY